MIHLTVLKASLNESSLDNLLKEIKSYKRKVDTLVPRLNQELAQSAVDHINQNLSGIQNLDGNLPGTTQISKEGNFTYVKNVGDDVAYLEFGTGKPSGHPMNEKLGIKQGVGPNIQTGTSSNKPYWKYFDPFTERFVTTNGIDAQMQVYNAAQSIKKEVVPRAKRLIK